MLKSSLPWIAFGALVASLVLLALVQSTWLESIAEADRQRLAAAADNALLALATDVDREVSRALVTFAGEIGSRRSARRSRGQVDDGDHPVDHDRLDHDDVERLWETWQDTAPIPELVEALYLVQLDRPRQALRFDGERWEESPLPIGSLDLENHGKPFSIVQPRLPGLLVPCFSFRHRHRAVHDHEPCATLAVVFDRELLRDTYLPTLIDRHLTPVLGEAPTVTVTVDEAPLFEWNPRDLDATQPFETTLFGVLPPAELKRFLAATTGFETREYRSQRRRIPSWPRAAGWTLTVTPAAGSLDALIARAHRGTVALSAGILLILTLAALALVVSTRRAQETARRQAELTATISHELRTPIAAVRSLGENLADGIVREPEQARLYGQQIVRQGERLSAMIEHVLMLSGLTARPPESREVPLAPLLREIADETRAGTNGDRGVARVEIDTPELTVHADPLALRRAIQNLVTNALEHGGSPPWARVEAARVNGDVHIAVHDRGPGIPSDERRHLFEPFFRGRRAQAGQVPGTGLGLHLVQRIAKRHGGRVEVRSGETGSTFTLIVPGENAVPGERAMPEGES